MLDLVELNRTEVTKACDEEAIETGFASAGRLPMVSKHHCPHTGVVNFFSETDPFMSIGSIVRAGASTEFHWRFYAAAQTIAGIASDMKTAERRLKDQIRIASSDRPH